MDANSRPESRRCCRDAETRVFAFVPKGVKRDLPGNVFPRPAEQTRQTAQARGHSPGPLPVRRLTGTGEACLSFRFAVVEPCAKIANRGSLLLDQPLALGQQGAQPFDPCR